MIRKGFATREHPAEVVGVDFVLLHVFISKTRIFPRWVWRTKTGDEHIYKGVCSLVSKPKAWIPMIH